MMRDLRFTRVLRWIVWLAVLIALIGGGVIGAERIRPAAPSEQTIVEFEFPSNVILLSALVNGRGPYKFLLDTGTDPSVLDHAVANEVAWIQVPVGAQGTGVGSDRVAVSLIPPITVQLAQLRPRRLFALALDLSAVSKRMEVPIHGILGHNFLRRYKLEVDYPRRELRFLPLDQSWTRDVSDPVFEGTLERLDGEDFPTLPEVFVNDTPVRASLDTGSNAGVTLYRPGVELLELQSVAAQAGVATVVGFNGEAGVHRGTIESVRIGPFEVDSVEARFVLDGHLADTPLAARGANLGNELWRHFVVGLDYPNGSIAIWRP